MKVAVLGCGPAGLIAAHAARSLGHDVTIFTKDPRPSKMYGCQYLHSPIPHATDLTRVAWVDYMLQGPIEGYRRKVYGDRAEVDLSPQTLTRHHPAWDLRRTYFRLWDYYAARIKVVEVGNHNLVDIIGDGGFDLCISSIPKPALCGDPEHQFESTTVYVRGEAPDLGISLDDIDCPRDMVICNGDKTPGWYRASNVFGHKTAEWPWAAGMPLNSGAVVQKPIGNNCDCWSRSVLYVGRYGAWRKGILASDVYSQTLTALRAVRV